MPETLSTPALTAWACPSCHRPVATSWLFCETCGTDFRVRRPDQLPTPVPLEPEPAKASIIQAAPMSFTVRSEDTFRDRFRDRLPERPSLLVVSAGLLVVVLIGVALTVHFQTRADLHRTQRQLATTQGQLSGTRSDLAASQAALADTKSDLAGETAKLSDAQGSLDDANDKLNLQSGQIDTLKSCLAGVNLAFSDFLDNSYDSALNELYSVQSDCDQAYALF